MPPAQGMTHIGRFFLMSSALYSLATYGMHRPVEGKQYVKKILAINICESAGWQKSLMSLTFVNSFVKFRVLKRDFLQNYFGVLGSIFHR